MAFLSTTFSARTPFSLSPPGLLSPTSLTPH
ncbi:unnamed protein product [Ectocarpus sp. 4 AP-2014]